MSPTVPPPQPPTVAEESTAPLGIPPEMIPDLNQLITEDDAPVDSIFAEKQQRLLTEPLYSSWAGPGEGKGFLVLANVGYFYSFKKPAVVPDVLLGLDVAPAGPLHTKEGHSYYQWLMEKPPDVVIEIVSDSHGGEEHYKYQLYARVGVVYYAIFDPRDLLGHGQLRAFAKQQGKYEPLAPSWLDDVGLGLTLWPGVFEDLDTTWLRWCDREGRVIPTGKERADQEKQRADQEKQRADQAAQRADRRAAQLRALGVEPEE